MKKTIKQKSNIKHEVSFFVLAGSAGFITDTAILLALNQYLNPFISRALSFGLALIVTWIINSRFTFKNKPKNIFRYIAGQNLGIIANYSVYTSCIYILGETKKDLISAMIISSTGAMVLNFFLMKYWAFNTKE